MSQSSKYEDVLIIGGGIAGMQSAIDLANQDFKVVIVEKEPSIGGKMIALSKVFPTLDCSSCICTPRMAEVAHHENITIYTYTEIDGIQREDSHIEVEFRQKPRYVNESDCTGCRLCEYACPIQFPDEFDEQLGVRKAVYVPFSNAIPQVALIDIDHCILCGLCEKECPTNAIDFLQEPVKHTIQVGAIILTTGYQLTPSDAKKEYGRGQLKNVLSPLQVERLLAPHGPYGRVLRPSDGKVPDSVAYVQCAGSRDLTQGVSYCSRVCCMYAIKQAMLLSGALPMVDVTIYYMDIRAFGKGFEEFYQNAKAMGIEFVKSKVAKITEDEDENPMVRIEVIEEDGRVEERKHDMVVLSLGMRPEWHGEGLMDLQSEEDQFVHTPQAKLAPCRTEQEGIFVAGTAAGPKDIPDSIIEAGAAAMEAANYLYQQENQKNKSTHDQDQ